MPATDKRNQAVSLIKSRLKKNAYTQGPDRDYVFGKPDGAEYGFGDCSSTVREAIKRAAGIDIGVNTSAQVANRDKGLLVEKAGDSQFAPTLGLLQPGDCVYFEGTPGNTWDVGHVEMVTGSDECCGHGNGTGPTKKNLTEYSEGRTGSKKYLCTIRWILDDTDPETVYHLGDRPLHKGMYDAPDVGELQTLLLQLEYDLGSWGADCDYGEKTAAAVKQEQAKFGYPQTGDADIPTIDAIKAHAAGKPIPAPSQHVEIYGGSVHIRSGPGTDYTVVGYAKSGDTFDASCATTEGWIGIIFQCKAAWVSSKYAEIIT